MVKDSFSILGEKMTELLKPYNFTYSFGGKEIIFRNKDRQYTIRYDIENQVISLFDLDCIKEEDKFCKSISSWYFSQEKMTSKDSDDICNDFLEIMVNKKKDTKIVKKTSGKEEENVGVIFFMNRLASIFPNIKEKIMIEKENNQNFRVVKFLNDEILPEIHKLFSNKKDNKIEKFFKLLENMYKNGDLDVRCIISMGILNNIDDEEMKNINKYLSEDFKKVMKASFKYK